MILSTVGPDGVPQATPIYFHVHEKKIYFNAIKDPPKKKVRNIQQNPNVCITTDRILPDGSFLWVSVIGKAKIMAGSARGAVPSRRATDPAEIAFVEEYTKREIAKYSPGGRGPVRGPWHNIWRNVFESIYLEVTPTKVLSYDSRKKTPELIDQLVDEDHR
jgi:nitroimidazol reductase NimA-like FMN-containing flavoprotein (pyridoxamine 5'-phosphate oxidase superfamily)